VNKQIEGYKLIHATQQWGDSNQEKGEVFTHPDVVDFMLSVSGIFDDILEESTRILEPSCGRGNFLIPLVEALLDAIDLCGKKPTPRHLKHKILAYDIVYENIEFTKHVLRQKLAKYYNKIEVEEILFHWFQKGDFLTDTINGNFSHIIGNPPYVRIENIPKVLLQEYRKRFITMNERSDLYIPFFEKSLSLLKTGGTLMFICTDRWTKNIYGQNLRALIDEHYALRLYIDLYGQKAFQSTVMTYPAITMISNSKTDAAVVVRNHELDSKLALEIKKVLNGNESNDKVFTRRKVTNGSSPWLLGCGDEITLVDKIEKQFPLIEKAGCKVYIGAATGNNKVYTVDAELAIEESRKIPMISASEIRGGSIQWKKRYLINTYDENGVINLEKYPLLKTYLESNKVELSQRHIAKVFPKKWFRTIDRVYPERAENAKLLIPDIASKLMIVYDEGNFHPNNSIYYICSQTWPLKALRTLLNSGIANLFIHVYSTKIANGFVRFQAQHLRKIRIPLWESLDENLKNELIIAGENEDRERSSEIVAKLYNLNENEIELIRNRTDGI
jgi:hypothetical protein